MNKLFGTALVAILSFAALSFSTEANATAPDTICKTTDGASKYELVIGRIGLAEHPDDFKELLIDGNPAIRFLESAFDFGFVAIGAPDNPEMLNASRAKVGDDEMDVIYPEQDPDADTFNILLSVKSPSKGIGLNQIEMTCQN